MSKNRIRMTLTGPCTAGGAPEHVARRHCHRTATRGLRGQHKTPECDPIAVRMSHAHFEEVRPELQIRLSFEACLVPARSEFSKHVTIGHDGQTGQWPSRSGERRMFECRQSTWAYSIFSKFAKSSGELYQDKIAKQYFEQSICSISSFEIVRDAQRWETPTGPASTYSPSFAHDCILS